MSKKPMWKCDDCGHETLDLEICWGISGGEKVDVIDYFCPACPSNDLTFSGTEEEKNEFWDNAWEAK